MSAALRVDGVTKAFGHHHVLRGVDLIVPTGSVTAVLGPSGGGKTTLLRIVAGFEMPDGGTVTIGDQVVASGQRSVAPERRRVGVVPQEGALFPHLSVAGNVGFGLTRQDRHGRRIAEVLELVGLTGTERMRPHELSGGQQHRVALARALAPRPSIVMLDEPFSSLDAGLRTQVRAEVLEALRATNSTAVIVTHDQLEALSIADQVAVLLDGRIAQAADPTEVYHRPSSLEVGTFIGEAVVLPGRFDGTTVECVLGRLPTIDAASCTTAPGPVQVLVRPEQLTVTAHAGTPHAGTPHASVEGVVVSRQYYGHDAVVSVRLRGDTIVTARLQTDRLPAVGASVRIGTCSPVNVFPPARLPVDSGRPAG